VSGLEPKLYYGSGCSQKFRLLVTASAPRHRRKNLMGSKDIIIIRAVMDIPDITAIKDATIVKAWKVLLS
jgi:hypothetical protein